MLSYPAAITCLAGAIRRVDLLLDILRVILGGRGILLGLDELGGFMTIEERVIVSFPFHVCGLPATVGTSGSIGVCRGRGRSIASNRRFAAVCGIASS